MNLLSINSMFNSHITTDTHAKTCEKAYDFSLGIQNDFYLAENCVEEVVLLGAIVGRR